MFRFTGVLVASLLSASAFASTPAEETLSKTVQIDLETTQGLLSEMDKSWTGWRSDERASAGITQAQSLVSRAQSSHAAGNDGEAMIALDKAWKAVAPGFQLWAKNADTKAMKDLAESLENNTADRIATLRACSTSPPADVQTMLDRAEQSNKAAVQLRTSGDYRGSLEKEREAMKGVEMAFHQMWRDWVADGIVAPPKPGTGSPDGL